MKKRLIYPMLFLALLFAGGAECKAHEVHKESSAIIQETDKNPEFPGGWEACAEYLHNNVKYPETCLSNKVEGKVVVSFVVSQDGFIEEVQVLESVNKDLDAEAVRVVSEMPKWKPGLKDGKVVRTKLMLPIRFSLPTPEEETEKVE